MYEVKQITITEEQLDAADKSKWPVIVLSGDTIEYVVAEGLVKGAVVQEYKGKV